MHSGNNSALRTRVYIDGYNLYYGCLKKTAYKWLDLRLLAERILANVPYWRNSEAVAYKFTTPAIKYFTAPILQPFAKSADSMSGQLCYHQALAGHLGVEFEIYRGYYHARPARAHTWEGGKPARECSRVDIWKLEEKQSDVALALLAYSGAIRNEVDQIVVITNDSDFQPAMQLIRQHTAAVIGLIAPIRAASGSVQRSTGETCSLDSQTHPR